MRQYKFYLFVSAFLLCGTFIFFEGRSNLSDAVFQLRLLKFASAFITGAALSAAGVLLQNLLRNPLADPYILGTSTGGALGALMAGVFGLSFFGLPFYACIIFGAFFTALLVCALAYYNGNNSIVKLLLAGIAINIFLSAIIVLVLMLGKSGNLGIISLLFGTISERPPFVITCGAAMAAIGFVLGLMLSRQLDILSLGVQKAVNLGVDVKAVNYMILFAAALLVSGTVALAGIIGFVGFAVPHIIRIMLGPKTKQLLWAAAFTGGAFLVFMQGLNNLIFYPQQLPVGILCSLCGAPLFIWVLLKNKGDLF